MYVSGRGPLTHSCGDRCAWLLCRNRASSESARRSGDAGGVAIRCAADATTSTRAWWSNDDGDGFVAELGCDFVWLSCCVLSGEARLSLPHVSVHVYACLLCRHYAHIHIHKQALIESFGHAGTDIPCHSTHAFTPYNSADRVGCRSDVRLYHTCYTATGVV